MYFQTLMEWKQINQTYTGGDVSSTKFLLRILISCHLSSTLDRMIDGFWKKWLDAAPWWAKPLLRRQLNHESLKRFCRQLLLPKKKWLILCPLDLATVVFGYGGIYPMRLTTYSSRQGHYCASVEANSQHFCTRKTLFPVVWFWSMPALRPFTLGCQNTLQALITAPTQSRSAASPSFNQQLARGTGTENAAEGCEAPVVLQQVVLLQIPVPPQLSQVLKLFVLV